ncbi:MAG: glycosyltransferase family 9 protein, partial [Alphaproteobacteria bacterium]
LSTGLLNRLLDDYPDDRVTIACGAPAAKVFAAVPRLERIHTIRKRSHSRHWFDLWRKTVPHKWRVLVDVRRSGSPYVHRAQEKFILPKTAAPIHRVELISATIGAPPLAPKIWFTEEHTDRAREIIGQDNDILAIAPGANWPGKIWPAHHFVELTQRLLGPGGMLEGGRLLLVGAHDERATAQPLIEAFPASRIHDAMGLDILSTYAALSHCRLFVGNDSAMMHLAAATGRPTVGLFGPTRDVYYAPWGPNGLVVRTPESVEDLIDHPGYDTLTTGTMMTSLTPQSVEQAVRTRWGDALSP